MKYPLKPALMNISENRANGVEFFVTRLLFTVSALILLAFASPAKAMTTEFGASIFDQTGPVINAGNALGLPDGATAIIGTGGVLTIDFGQSTSGEDITLSLLANGFLSFGAISIGEVIGGVAVFSAETGFNTFAGGVLTFDLSAQCAAISTGGCSLIRIRNVFSFFSTGIALDGVSGVNANPEPGQWALMIIAFVLIAGRLKQLRRRPVVGVLAPSAV